jgi:aminoglycoside 6'-N-acetyltransferase I
MDICAITKQDLQVISQLYVSVFSEPPWNEDWETAWAYERLNWIYQSPGFVGYIALDSQQIIGAIMGHFVPFKGEKGFEIVEFLVATNCQNQGIGNNLLTQLELNLHQNNYDYIWLLTAKDSSAESFYSKRNYQRDCKIVLLKKEL